jgi:opacity protein-like surface antigen
MKRLRVLSVAAVGVLAAVAVSSASAFSPPEIGRCVKVTAGTGKFSSATCIKEAKGGSFEWLPGAVKNKITTTGGVGTLATVSGIAVSCKTESSGGELNSPKTVVGVVVRFTSCESGGFKCATAGAKEGEIVTNPLEGKIGIENKLKHKLALDLFPTAADGGLYVTFNCGASLHITVGGSVLVPITPIDKMIGPGLTVTTLTLKYVSKLGHQVPEHFEGEPNDVLLTQINGGKIEQSGVTISSKQSAEEDLEVNFFF